ncbi:hypothetical protein Lal_00033620 [Lupinus albus]|nr:hypothetical protein Lal_00033620 [Lupinus albus]
MNAGGSSSAARGKTAARSDPYYSPELLAKFKGRLSAHTRYTDITWWTDQGFALPHQLKMQGVDTFLEMDDKRKIDHFEN